MQHTRKSIHSLILLSMVLLSSFTATAQVPETQRQALVDLYNDTGGSNWNNNSNWLVNDPCADQWYGVSCDADDNIIGLFMHRNGLRFKVPASISALTQLEVLDLSFNNFNAETPEIGQLSALRVLDLEISYHALFPYQFPQWVLNLSNLQELDLEVSGIVGQIPAGIGQLSQLKVLDLSNNLLSGTLPDDLWTLSQLRELKIMDEFGDPGHQFTNGISSQIANLSNLEVLTIGSSEETGVDFGSIPEAISELSNLRMLALEGPFIGSIPESFVGLSQLEFLHIRSNTLQANEFPAFVMQLSNLNHLTLSANITGEIPDELFSLTGLTWLKLDRNLLSGSIPPALGQLTQLSALWLEHNLLTGAIPTQLGAMNSLYILQLGHNRLSGQYPSWLHATQSLQHVDISNNLIQGRLQNSYFQQQSFPTFHSEYNALTAEAELLSMLDDACFCDWVGTQTTPATGLQALQLDDEHVLLSWEPIEFGDSDGGYQVWLSADGAGEFVLHDEVPSKSTSAYVINDLLPDQSYEYRLVTFSAINKDYLGYPGHVVYSLPSEPHSFQTALMSPAEVSLDVTLEAIDLDGFNVDAYDFIISNTGSSAVNQLELNIYGHNPDSAQSNFGFQVRCIESSQGLTCPDYSDHIDNFSTTIDLPANAWFRIQVNVFTQHGIFRFVEPPRHLIQVLPPFGLTDDDFFDNQFAIKLEEVIYLSSF